ncbi:hypothetical protein Taro_042350 [Colocasia esculenta]|uniref:MEKHLA domain-containing protein n=1 Tax=Colocasia esculenta TaxID=4460 RepID=A0A843WNR1_COLES|nr:hypothetical protein [Colocasia esculenta]
MCSNDDSHLAWRCAFRSLASAIVVFFQRGGFPRGGIPKPCHFCLCFRGFNDAINGFIDDGWSLLAGDGAEDVVIATNSTKTTNGQVDSAGALAVSGGIMCAKASMLLQNVPPALLVRFLREHHSEWADYNIDAYAAASLKTGSCCFPGLRPIRFSGNQIIMPLAHTVENEEFLEVIRLEGQTLAADDGLLSRDVHLLQLCSGVDESAVGACLQLVFSPIDELFRDDAPLLPSGFHVIPLDSKTVSPDPALGLYFHMGVELLQSGGETGDSLLKMLWHHQDAILCCSLKAMPVFTFANQAGLDMLETTLVALQDITLDKIFDESGRKALCSEFAKLMQQVTQL